MFIILRCELNFVKGRKPEKARWRGEVSLDNSVLIIRCSILGFEVGSQARGRSGGGRRRRRRRGGGVGKGGGCSGSSCGLRGLGRGWWWWRDGRGGGGWWRSVGRWGRKTR